MKLHKKLLVLLVGMILLTYLAGCYPKFGDSHPTRGYPVPFVASDPGTNGEQDSPIWVVSTKSLKECLGGAGHAKVEAVWSKDLGKLTESQRTLPCSETSLLEGEDLAAIFDIGEGFYSWEKPLVGLQKPPDKGTILMSIERVLVAVEGDRIQVITSSLGNREGVEIEHVYTIRNGFIKTERSEARTTILEPFPEL